MNKPATTDWFISDLHLGHKNSISFMRGNGEPLRPFANVDEMDDAIIDNINSKVKQNDRLYLLGDVTMPKTAIHKLARINGKKILIPGNHDHNFSLYNGIIDKILVYAQYKDNTILSHVPVHESQLTRWTRNIHGHTHEQHIVDLQTNKRDIRYYNVSCDCYSHGIPGTKEYHSGMNFFPKSYDEIRAELGFD